MRAPVGANKFIRPSATGGFQMLRTSEVKKVSCELMFLVHSQSLLSQNSLNPDWNDFLFSENELNGGDETLKLK